jgi:hypothetical protein
MRVGLANNRSNPRAIHIVGNSKKQGQSSERVTRTIDAAAVLIDALESEFRC